MAANDSAVVPLGSVSPAVIERPRMRAGLRMWTLLFSLALSTRLIAAFILPNAEQDGYSYAEIAARWSANLSASRFRLTDLFGFWLPLFQLATAILNVWINNSLLAGKILSALCGATSCLLVFAITEKLTRSVALAWFAFALLVSSPLHILYSAACMTDVPEGCLVLASLWFVMQRRWVVAAMFGALAEGVRIEAWVLVIVLPLLQLAWERRISLLTLTILIFPPLVWLGICYFATGDPLAFFAKRARYQANYLDFHPMRRGFAFADVWRDVDYFLLGANRGVVLAGLLAAGLSIVRSARELRRPPLDVAATLAYAAALFSVIFFSYVTKRQPVLFPRYGLIFFTLGLPLLMWLVRYSYSIRPSKRLILKLILAVAIAICLWEAKRQVPIISKVVADYHARRQIAHTLAAALQEPRDFEHRCFSDDPAVRFLSGLAATRFLRSETAPPMAWQDVTSFESYLRQENVGYLVFTSIEDSLPARFYPDLRGNARGDTGIFQFVAFAPSPFAPDVWLFRVRNE
jgi:hypothetical protein